MFLENNSFLNTLANLIKMVTTEATTATDWNSLST